MNILPTTPDVTSSQKDIERYFNDMKRWNFTVAYNSFYATAFSDVLGEFRDSHIGFVKKAEECGFKACVQIQSTVGNMDDVSVENAQYFLDNTFHSYEHFAGKGRKNFFGSFAAPGWLEYLKKAANVFRELGYHWVVFEEPMFHVDVPGTKDKFYELFKKEYPDLEYPTKQMPCKEYYLIQELKQKVLTGFYDALTQYSKEIGYEKVGIMPWFFCPTFENTPIETWSSSCDTGKITFLKNLDFIIVRVQPDNIRSEAVIASNGEMLPRLVYTEVLAHSLGKPTIAVNNPTNEHMPHGMDAIEMIPLNYFKKYTLSAFAGAPSGMSRHWYGKNYGEDQERMELYTEINKYMPRFGKAVSPVAFMFTTRTQARVLPRSWKDIWKIYWTFVTKMQYENKMPFVTLFGDRLEESLRNNPEVKIIILSEYFPLSPEEIELLKKWVEASEDRTLIYLGAGNGYRYDFSSMYFSFDWRPSEMAEIFGIDTAKPIMPCAEDDIIDLIYCGRHKEDAFLGEKPAVEAAGYGIPSFSEIEESGWETLYKTKYGNVPVVRMKKIPGGGTLLYSGLSMDSPSNSFPVMNLMNYMMKKTAVSGSGYPALVKASRGIYWNKTSADYVVVSNIDNSEGKYEIPMKNGFLWDVKNRKRITGDFTFSINPLDFHVYRIIGNNEKFLDIDGITYLSGIQKESEKTIIKTMPGRNIKITVSDSPGEIFINGDKIEYYVDHKNEYSEITINNLKLKDSEIILQW